jgi:putative transposase
LARLPRLAVAGLPHHVIQRGHNRQPIFIDDADRRSYLSALRDTARESGVAVHAYALLTDCVELIVTPTDPKALSLMMQRLGRRYVANFNRRHGRLGTLWEGRFRSTVVEPARYLLACMRHVELGPVRQGLARYPQEFVWSSAAHHLGLRQDPIVVEHAIYWGLGNTPFEREDSYRHFAEQALTPSEEVRIAEAAAKGWVLGSDEFVASLGGNIRRRLQPLRRGRPSTRKIAAAL